MKNRATKLSILIREKKKKIVFFAKILYDLVATINAHLVEVCLHIQKHKKKTFEG
jgi:hypothetical protein